MMGPPYTEAEQQDLYRRIDGGLNCMACKGPRTAGPGAAPQSSEPDQQQLTVTHRQLALQLADLLDQRARAARRHPNDVREIAESLYEGSSTTSSSAC